jgi:hypothetical protein
MSRETPPPPRKQRQLFSWLHRDITPVLPLAGRTFSPFRMIRRIFRGISKLLYISLLVAYLQTIFCRSAMFCRMWVLIFLRILQHYFEGFHQSLHLQDKCMRRTITDLCLARPPPSLFLITSDTGHGVVQLRLPQSRIKNLSVAIHQYVRSQRRINEAEATNSLRMLLIVAPAHGSENPCHGFSRQAGVAAIRVVGLQ